MVLQKATACGMCSNAWKNGDGNIWGLGRLYWKTPTAKTLKIVHGKSNAELRLVKAILNPSVGHYHQTTTNSCSENDHISRGFGAGGFSVPRRPCIAVEAGRSKAKKGQNSGGRIEKRPVSTRRTKPFNPDEVSNRTADGANVSEGEQRITDASNGQTQRRVGSRGEEEEEINSTWAEAGLMARRRGGKFLPEVGAPQRNTQRVGGWGRDKSMQRVITPEQQREGIGGRGDRRNRPKKQMSDTPVVRKKKPHWNAGFDPDPRVRHPPEYYKYGPYGPYAWKGAVVGKVVKGTFATNQVVYFSNVKDEAESEDRERANVTVQYTNSVTIFDPRVGIQFFYAFARRRYGPRPDPWQDWTLVAQIAVESGEELGEQGELFRKMGSRAQDITTQCVAWARPDLTYVKRPKFDLRLEPQESFLKELFNLLEPTREKNDPNSYYATLCKLVDVDLEASARRVRYGFEALDENGQMECLKHVFDNHPVKILSSARYERDRRIHQGEIESEEEIDDESEGSLDVEDEYHQEDQRAERIREVEDSEEIKGKGELHGRRGGQFEAANGVSITKGLSEGVTRTRGGRTKRVFTLPSVRSAVRPYSYSNIIEEIAEIRIYLSGKQSVLSAR